MNGVTNLFALLGGSIRFKMLLLLLLCWAAFYLICYLFGGMGLSALGRKKHIKSRFLAWVPIAQIVCELRLVRAKNERQVVFLLWWWAALIALGLTCGIWGAVAYFHGLIAVYRLLLILMLLFWAAGLAAYIWVRVLEFRILRYLFRKDQAYWIISICGIIVGIPLQRLFLYVLRNKKI